MFTEVLTAIVLGLVQGITEFLPVSSSGHLVILHSWLRLPLPDSLGFDVAIHFASFLAVAYYFRREILKLGLAWQESLRGKPTGESRLAWQILLATIPAALLGWLWEDFIETKLRSLLVVAIALAVGGGLFLLVEKYGRLKYRLELLGWRQSIIIGLAQALAFIPGTSRSGITIISGLALGLKREAAVKFSFLLSLPILFGAGIKKIPPLLSAGIGDYELSLVLLGAIASLISSWWAIKFLLNYINKHSFVLFAYYRLLLAIVLAVVWFLV